MRDIKWGIIVAGFFIGLGIAARPILDYVYWLYERGL